MIALPDPQEVRRFQVRIVELLGLYFDESKFGNLARILHNRLLSRGGTYTQYIESLSDAPANEEIGSLARELTVTETYFLRNIEQFRAYAAVALPQRAAAAGNGQCIRILSAGCASGDEAYSLAIAAREYFPALADNISITAVDVNPAMLQKAARAHYTNWSLRECPDELKARWFKSDGDTFILSDAIRRMVKFEARNLTHEDADFWQPLRFDIVFCRNVLMYFNGVQMQAAVQRIARAMAPGGYLFLGHAETLRAVSNDFHLCHSHDTFYYRRKDQLAAPAPAPLPVGSPAQAGWQPTSPKLDTGWITAIQEASERIHALIPQGTDEVVKRPAPASRPVANLHRALEFLHNERFDLTLEQIGGLPAEQANAPDVLLLKAVSLSHSGALTQAEAACRELLLRDALNAGAHYILALCSEGAGDVEAAIEHDQAAVYLDPGFAMPRFHIGLLARRRGDRQSAHRDLSEALVLLQKEDASRVLLFGGGFKREALIDLCRAELAALGESA